MLLLYTLRNVWELFATRPHFSLSVGTVTIPQLSKMNRLPKYSCIYLTICLQQSLKIFLAVTSKVQNSAENPLQKLNSALLAVIKSTCLSCFCPLGKLKWTVMSNWQTTVANNTAKYSPLHRKFFQISLTACRYEEARSLVSLLACQCQLFNEKYANQNNCNKHEITTKISVDERLHASNKASAT